MHVGSDKTENVLGKISMMQAIVRNHYLNMKPNQPPIPPKKGKENSNNRISKLTIWKDQHYL